MTIDVPAAGRPRPFRWTCRLFRAADDYGLFEGHRAFIVRGELFEEGQESPQHGCARQLISDTFYRAFSGCHLYQRMPLELSDTTELRPDVFVGSGGIREYCRNPTTPVFVAEVADHSLAFDTTTKAVLYATAGVLDYWVLDVNARQLLVFRDPQPDPVAPGTHTYATRLTLNPTDTVSPLAAPTATVTVADLLP
jgi:Uma2 family endonuclease